MKRKAILAALMLLGAVLAFPTPVRAETSSMPSGGSAPESAPRVAPPAGLEQRTRLPASLAERTVAAARDAAQHDRNAEAAALFQRAISLDPSRRAEWLHELADQMTYSGHAAEAISLYREVLAAREAGSCLAGRSSDHGDRLIARTADRPSAAPEHRSPPPPPVRGGGTDDEARRAQRGLALALSWSHQLTAALREYDALLREEENDIEARLGRARVLSWMDRHEPALREYEAVLRQDPGNLEARRSLGRVQSWRGKHRDAQRRLTEFLREHPGDPEGALLLAQSQAWMGRPDRAKQTLRDLLDQHPEEPRGKQFLEQIRRREQPETGVEYEQSHQSDGLVISTKRFQQNVPHDEGRTTLGARYQEITYDPARSQPAIAVKRPGVFARQRFGDGSELSGSFFLDLIEPGGHAKGYTEVTYDTYLTLWPNDVLRFDLGSSRTTFDNVTSLSRGITGTYANFSMDVVPDEKTRFTTRFNWGSYTDGNERRWGQVEAERRVWTHPNLLIGACYTAFGFSKRLDHGYFNPDSYQAGVLTLRLYGHDGDRFHYDFDGSYGREHAHPGGSKPFRSASVRLGYRLADRIEIEGRYQFFSSTQSSSSGFARRTTGISLRFLF